jgi:hypothetical protein
VSIQVAPGRKEIAITTFRIQELESLGFEWDRSCVTAWDDHFSELANYRKNGHCNVPKNNSENAALAQRFTHQRFQYKLHEEGKAPSMTAFRIQVFESLGFEWKLCVPASWEDRLSELADYRKIHGHTAMFLKCTAKTPSLLIGS